MLLRKDLFDCGLILLSMIYISICTAFQITLLIALKSLGRKLNMSCIIHEIDITIRYLVHNLM